MARTRTRKPKQGGPGGTGLFGGGTIPQATATTYASPPSTANDPNLLAAQDQGQRQTQVADATAQYQNGLLGLTYGFDQNGGIDPNNPYSRASLLQEQFRRNRAGNTNSYAAQGHLYSGALQNAQNETARNYNIGNDALLKQYAADKGQVLTNQLAAYGSATGGVSSAGLQALLDALKGS